jgi:endonuclease/exonuclease/phosphatase family metal-dependent hydrolase
MTAMRVVTFNIRHGEPTGGGPVDVARLQAACAALDADVLALQEVDRDVPRSGRQDLWAAVAAATGMAAAFARARGVDGGSYGIALLSRAPLTDVVGVRLPRFPHQEPRVAVLARTAGISFAATHLGVRQWESRVQLAAVIRRLRRRPGPRVLLGDLNRRPDQVVEVLRRRRFEPAGGAATFPAHRPRWQIDHVAVDGIGVRSVDVVATGVSDHRALVVSVGGPGTPRSC